MKIEFDIKGIFFSITTKGGFRLIILRRPYIKVKGITSRCKDGSHVLFLEFDSTFRWLVEDYARIVQHKYKLPTIYMIRSSVGKYENGQETGNYHLISPAKLTVGLISEIQQFVPIDRNFKFAWVYNFWKSWVLRTSWKGVKKPPIFIGLIKGRDAGKYQISTVHKMFMEKYYNAPKVKYKREDGEDKLFYCTYKTAHK